MAGAISLYGAQEVLGNFFGHLSLFPGVFYVALVLDNPPTAFMSGAELDEPDENKGYQRTAIVNNASMWRSEAETYSNAAEIRFAPANGGWGTVKFWTLCNAQIAGDYYFFGDLGEEIPVEATDELLIPVGTLNFTIPNLFTGSGDGD